ncbi:hypothetical protein, partial [Microbulbifer sp. 2205BS26-8]|uniref:hypothetical protein n=1 Tax=Microbulbifer sp. 2205BS26-8 TaxID=3064386 RepID=UPI00273EF246
DLQSMLGQTDENLRVMSAQSELRNIGVLSLNSQAVSGMDGALSTGMSLIKNGGLSLGNPVSFGIGVVADFAQSQSGISTSHFIGCPGGSCEAYLIINNDSEVYRVY